MPNWAVPLYRSGTGNPTQAWLLSGPQTQVCATHFLQRLSLSIKLWWKLMEKRSLLWTAMLTFFWLPRRGGTKVLTLDYPIKTLQESLQNIVRKSLFIITKQSMEREEEMVMSFFLTGWFFLYLDCRFFFKSFDSIIVFHMLDNFDIYTITVMTECSFIHNIYSGISFFISCKPMGLTKRKIWQHLDFSSWSIHFSSM